MHHARSSFAAFAAELAAYIQQHSLPILAISGAQGSGKSTLAQLIAGQLRQGGNCVGVVSLDDFYLNKASRAQLAASIDPRLQQRGVPGTHDLDAALTLTKRHLQGQSVALPRFDKALDEPGAAEPCQRYDCLIVEGWCIGLAPTEPLVPLDAYQCFIERSLALYQAWFARLTPLVFLQAPDWQQVCAWRLQQEQQLRASRGKGMSDAETAVFMQAFQPLTERAWQQLPSIADWLAVLDAQHQISRIETVNRVG